jgi:uncharacterized protein (PEP-CTERM system associated)
MAITGALTRLKPRRAQTQAAYRFRARLLGGAFACAASVAYADTWLLVPSIGIEETLTNNVNLQPAESRKADLVTQITPGFSFVGSSAHSSVSGSVSAPILLYARTGSENNAVLPFVNIFGSAELVERFFFVEGSANVSQQYLTPFGSRSSSLATRTGNQYTSQVYRVTPYFKGVAGGEVDYLLRLNNTWTKGDATAVNDSYTNEILGTLQRDPRPFGWGADYDRVETKFQSQQSLVTELVRGRGLYQADPQLRLSISGGYEKNDFLLIDHDNAIYGLGARWRPTERTDVDASWEHRFFGGSYDFNFRHRTALSTWNVYAFRNITSYPQQFATLGAGVDVQNALNQLFSSRIPDAAQRQNLVNQLILDRGLPASLSGPVNLYTQQITLQQVLGTTVGLLGARNNVLLTAFRSRSEPISGTGTPLPDILAVFENNTQYGANVVWATTLTPLVTLTTTVDALRTVSNSEQAATTKQASIRAMLTTAVSPLTAVYAGLRYQLLRSSTDVASPFVQSNYDEVAVFVGLNHRFQ